MSEPYYITTAIAYPNGAPHIGHAYEYIAPTHWRDSSDSTATRCCLSPAPTSTARRCRDRRERGRPDPRSWPIATPPFQRLQEMLGNILRPVHPHDRRRSPRRIPRDLGADEGDGDIYLDKFSGWYSVRDEASTPIPN